MSGIFHWHGVFSFSFAPQKLPDLLLREAV